MTGSGSNGSKLGDHSVCTSTLSEPSTNLEIEPKRALGQCWVLPINDSVIAIYNQQGLLRAYSFPDITAEEGR